MPLLNWIGKESIINHDKDVPFHLLRKLSPLSLGTSENLLLEGDNLESLKALIPYYQNKVKCIYIDPPYNTGNENWIYSDSVNAPKIKSWLGNVVDSDDLSRHDKWACMIYPRLKLLRDLLSEDGLIFVSIGDDEVQTLKIIMNEIFGVDSFVSQMIWNTEGSTDNTLEIKIVHEYILVYIKNNKFRKKAFESVIAPDIKKGKLFKPDIENTATKNGKGNPPSEIMLPIGFPSEVNVITFRKNDISEDFFTKARKYGYIPRDLTRQFNVTYPIRKDIMVIENFKLQKPCRVYSGWGNLNKLKQFIANDCRSVKNDDGDFSYFLSKNGVIIYKKERKRPRNILSVIRDVGTTTQSRNQLEDMGIDFDYPKPVNLVMYLIKMSTREDSIVMDSFAGSGTTGEAVLRLNREDGKRRRFILIELEKQICKKAQQRLTKVIKGYVGKRTHSKIAGIGGEFQYSVLDKVLFDKNGRIDQSCNFEELASYIYFTETKMTADKNLFNGNLIGEHLGTRYYLIFRGVGKNTLTSSYVRRLSSNSINVVYADNCTASQDELEKYNTIFKQIPYEVRVF